MGRSDETREALLRAAKALFWTRGFSNVSVRDVAREASVDVALISRYFGGKRGLFEATLTGLPLLDLGEVRDADALIARIVAMFVDAPRGEGVVSPTGLILVNASDPEVGEMVRRAYETCWQVPMTQVLESDARAAAVSAVMLGMSVAEKSLRLNGIPDPASSEYRATLTALLRAALEVA